MGHLRLDSASLVQASAVLILLAGGILVYRAFRERYLLAWLLGWVAYLLHKVAGDAAGAPPGALWPVLSHVFFTAAIFLMAAAVLFYTNRTRWLLPLAIIGMVALDTAVVRIVWFPGSALVGYGLDALYTIIKIVAAVQMALFARGRPNLGPWLLTFSFLFVHMHEYATPPHAIPALDLFIELLLGLSMVIIVLDDSHMRSRRLAVVNALTAVIATSQDFRQIMQTVLEQLKGLLDARTAWFRALEGDELVLGLQVGASDTFLGSRHAIPVRSSFSGRTIQQRLPGMIRASATDPATMQRLAADGFDHVVVVPVYGKDSVVGTMAFASPHHRNYRPDEFQFLTATAGQVGVAYENLRLFQQIARSQKQWTYTFDSISDSILVHDDHRRIMKVNRALLSRLGVQYKDVIGATCESVLPHRDQEWTLCPYCGRDEFMDAPDPCFDGYSLVSTSSYSGEGPENTGTIHIIHDTTEHRAAEERYRLFFERVQEGVFVSTPDGRLLDCNDAFVRMLGYSGREELLAVDIAHDLYVSPRQRELFRAHIAEHGSVRDFEFQLRRKDGGILEVRESSFAIRDSRGQVERYQGFLLDVTEEKRAANEIRRRNRELHVLNQIASAANQSFDLDHILKQALQQVVELFSADTGAIYLFEEKTLTLRRRARHGYRTAVGDAIDQFQIPQDFWDLVRDSRTQVITDQHLAHLPPVITELVQAEGLQSWLWLLLWTNDKVVGTLGISSRSRRDFTADDENLLVAVGRQLAMTIEKVHLYEETRLAYDNLTRTQEQLLQSEKMSAVGQLISGVAHELNNPLTAILGYSQLLENEELAARARDFVQKLYRQAQRTHKIVQNLLSFSRQRKPQKTPVDFRRVLEETLALRDYDLKLNNITVERDFQSPLPSVTADAHQIEQVFLNIINNSVDAMLEAARGGTLRVRVFAEDGKVCAEFHDTGPGIRDPKRIFDPFYTTKGVGKGTGLGLSICYGIVKEHSGEILASNHADRGAVISVRVPVAVGAPEPEVKARSPRKQALQGRILVVDDEEAVLDFEAEVLRGAGAEVDALATGEQAIAALQAHSYDAVIIDGKMPGGWSGVDIYLWVAENRPGLERCILFAISNFGDNDIRQFIEERKVPCIVKPFEVADLVAMAGRLLKKSRAIAATS